MFNVNLSQPSTDGTPDNWSRWTGFRGPRQALLELDDKLAGLCDLALLAPLLWSSPLS